MHVKKRVRMSCGLLKQNPRRDNNETDDDGSKDDEEEEEQAYEGC